MPFFIEHEFYEPDLSSIELFMSTDVDVSTINATSVRLFAGGSQIPSETFYDASSRRLVLRPLRAASENVDYELVLDPTKIRNLAGNSLSTDEIPESFALTDGTLVRTYRVDGTAVANGETGFFWEHPFVNESTFEIRFSRGIDTPTNTAQYALRYCPLDADEQPEDCEQSQFIAHSLSDATLTYDRIDSRLVIDGLDIPTGTGGTLVQMQFLDVTDTAGNPLPSCDSGPDYSAEIDGCRGHDVVEILLSSGSIDSKFAFDDLAFALSARAFPQSTTA